MSQTEASAPATPPAPAPEPPLQRLSRWLTLGANIGVVLGLFLLIVELRQNAALSSLSNEIAMSNLLADIEMHLAAPEQSEAWVKSYMAPETMTDVDIRMNEAVLVSLTMQWDYAFQLEKAGLRTPEEVERLIRNTAPIYFGSRFGKTWFEQQAPFWEGTRMVEVARPIVAALDENFMRDFYTGLRNDMQTPATANP